MALGIEHKRTAARLDGAEVYYALEMTFVVGFGQLRFTGPVDVVSGIKTLVTGRTIIGDNRKGATVDEEIWTD